MNLWFYTLYCCFSFLQNLRVIHSNLPADPTLTPGIILSRFISQQSPLFLYIYIFFLFYAVFLHQVSPEGPAARTWERKAAIYNSNRPLTRKNTQRPSLQASQRKPANGLQPAPRWARLLPPPGTRGIFQAVLRLECHVRTESSGRKQKVNLWGIRVFSESTTNPLISTHLQQHRWEAESPPPPPTEHKQPVFVIRWRWLITAEGTKR